MWFSKLADVVTINIRTRRLSSDDDVASGGNSDRCFGASGLARGNTGQDFFFTVQVNAETSSMTGLFHRLSVYSKELNQKANRK